MGMWSSGKTTILQAVNVGSIPNFSIFALLAQWESTRLKID